MGDRRGQHTHIITVTEICTTDSEMGKGEAAMEWRLAAAGDSRSLESTVVSRGGSGGVGEVESRRTGEAESA